MNGIAMANLLTVITIYMLAEIGMETHVWLSAWWFVPIWAGWLALLYVATHRKPKTDRELRPWLYHGDPRQ